MPGNNGFPESIRADPPADACLSCQVSSEKPAVVAVSMPVL